MSVSLNSEERRMELKWTLVKIPPNWCQYLKNKNPRVDVSSSRAAPLLGY